MGRPVPDPPQLLHIALPVPAQVLQPTSPSDQREQRQGTRRDPLQVGQGGFMEKLDEEISGGKFIAIVDKMGKTGSRVTGAESGCGESAEGRR